MIDSGLLHGGEGFLLVGKDDDLSGRVRKDYLVFCDGRAQL